jgi:hypothetical protein
MSRLPGRPRTRNSRRALAEKWGVSTRQAYAISKMKLEGDALKIMINIAKRARKKVDIAVS